MDGQSVIDENENERMEEVEVIGITGEQLWRRNRVMMDALWITPNTDRTAMTEERIMIVDEILSGERRGMMYEYWKLREQSINQERKIDHGQRREGDDTGNDVLGGVNGRGHGKKHESR